MEENLEYIDAYFQRMLDTEEIKRFEQRLAEDNDFAEEVAFYLSAKQSLKAEAELERKQRFRELLSQQSPVVNIDRRSTQRIWIYRLSAAAAVIIIAFFAWSIFFSQSAPPEQIADNYINKELKTLGVTMSASLDSTQNGLRLYNSGQYDSALLIFEALRQRNPGNYEPKKYAGITYLQLGNYEKALQYFRQFEKDTLYSNSSLFYQALTLLKRNLPDDKQKARELLQRVVDNDLGEKGTAQEWLKKW
jgi:tetratricopeptide (TPR) repeat protein